MGQMSQAVRATYFLAIIGGHVADATLNGASQVALDLRKSFGIILGTQLVMCPARRAEASMCSPSHVQPLSGAPG